MSETDPLENALQKGTFNVLEAVKGRGYPTDKVTIYTAFDAEYEARAIESKMQALDSKSKAAAVVKERNELQSSLDACLQRIKDSALVFHLRGVSPNVHEALTKEADALLADESNEAITDDDSRNEYVNDATIAAHIVKVTSAQGDEDAEWSREKVAALRDVIPDGELLKLLEKVYELSFQSAAFDRVVGPDFS